MNHELMITEYETHKCACYYEEGRLTELNVLPPASILGNIYVGRVQNIVKNLDAAFVEVQPGVVCFYSLTDNKHIFLNQKRTEDQSTTGQFRSSPDRESGRCYPGSTYGRCFQETAER